MGRKLSTVGNEGNPNKVGDFNRSVKIGSALKQGGMSLRGSVVSDALSLETKAVAVVSALAIAGGTTGALTPVASATPAAGEVGVDRLGNIVFAAADAITSVEVVYIPAEGDTISSGGVCDAAGAVKIANGSTARIVTSAEVDGNARTVIDRGGAPAVGEVALSLDGATVQFNVADAGLQAVFTYVEFPAQTVVERLDSEVDY